MSEVPAPAPLAEAYQPTKLPDSFVGRWVLPNAGGIVALVLLAPAMLIGIPFAAWAVAAGMWLVNRLGHAMTLRLVDGLPRTMAVGAAGIGMMLRVWTIAFVLFFIGADLRVGEARLGAGREDIALPAMLLFMVIVTFDIAIRSIAELRRYKAADTTTSEENPA